MELEYKESRSKARFVVVAGVILAILAGGLAFYTVNQAQQQAGQGSTKKVSLVVAVAPIPARQVIKVGDLALREVPLDNTNANGTINDPTLAVGRIAAVTIGPDSEAVRAVAITVPDDLALGGMLVVGQTVDVFVTAVVNPNDPTGTYVVDRSTKITYQDVVILARSGSFYVIRASLPVAIMTFLASSVCTPASVWTSTLPPPLSVAKPETRSTLARFSSISTPLECLLTMPSLRSFTFG